MYSREENLWMEGFGIYDSLNVKSKKIFLHKYAEIFLRIFFIYLYKIKPRLIFPVDTRCQPISFSFSSALDKLLKGTKLKM